MSNPNLSSDKDGLTTVDAAFENTIRPGQIDDFSGQDQIIENLRIFIKAAKIRGEALDHVLFHGPPGLGKTTLSRIVSNELGVNIKETSGPVIEKPGDLAGKFPEVRMGCIFCAADKATIDLTPCCCSRAISTLPLIVAVYAKSGT